MPAATPLTMPEATVMAATVAALVLQVPPAGALASVAVDPAHSSAAPDIASGSGLTVTVVVRWQPVAAIV